MQTVKANALYIVAWCDPASGPVANKSLSGSSRSSIVVIGQDNLERVYILEAWASRIPPDKLIDRIFETHDKWRPSLFGLDVTGPQLTFGQIIQKEVRERASTIRLKPSALKTDKRFSIEHSIQPVASSGRMFRPPEREVRGLMDEFKAFPDGMYRDTLDALACALGLLPTVLPEHMRQMNRDQLRNYLARTGMSREDIERRLTQHLEMVQGE